MHAFLQESFSVAFIHIWKYYYNMIYKKTCFDAITNNKIDKMI